MIPKPNILDVTDRYKVRTPCPSQRTGRLEGGGWGGTTDEGMKGQEKGDEGTDHG